MNSTSSKQRETSSWKNGGILQKGASRNGEKTTRSCMRFQRNSTSTFQIHHHSNANNSMRLEKHVHNGIWWVAVAVRLGYLTLALSETNDIWRLMLVHEDTQISPWTATLKALSSSLWRAVWRCTSNLHPLFKTEVVWRSRRAWGPPRPPACIRSAQSRRGPERIRNSENDEINYIYHLIFFEIAT